MAFLLASRMIPFLGGGVSSVGRVVGSVASPISKGVGSLFSGVSNALGGLFGFGRQVGSTLSSAAGAVGQGFNLLTSPILWIGGAVVAAVVLLRR